jgi:hypothetical protein
VSERSPGPAVISVLRQSGIDGFMAGNNKTHEMNRVTLLACHLRKQALILCKEINVMSAIHTNASFTDSVHRDLHKLSSSRTALLPMSALLLD